MDKSKKNINVWSFITITIFILYLIFLVYPLFKLLAKSSIDEKTGALSLVYFRKFFSKKYYYGTVTNSLKVTFMVTVLSIILATPLAYIMGTFKIKGSKFLETAIIISSMQPPFIGAYSWILLLGRNGLVTNFMKNTFNIQMPSIYGFSGILLVLTLKLAPFIYLYLIGALKNIDNALLEAAESMGVTGIKKIFKVLLPLLMPTLLGGALLVFMSALADFGTPMLIGEGYRTVPVLIFNEFIGETGGTDGFAAAISVIVIVFAVAVFLLQKYISDKMAFSMSALNPIRPKKERGLKNILAHGYVYLFSAIALLPQVYVIYTSFLNTSGMVFVKGYSLNSYTQAIDKALDSLKNTFFLAGISIIIVIFLAILIAYVIVRRKNIVTNILDVMTMLPYIVPGSIMGIGLLVSFNKKPLLLSGTALIMIVAFVIRRLPYTIRSSAAIVHQINPEIEEAAISLGTSNIKTFFKITLPMMVPGVLSGAILSWITIISELSASVLLYTPRTRTMTTAIYIEVLRGNYGVAAAISTVLTIVTTISLLLLFKFTGKKDLTL